MTVLTNHQHTLHDLMDPQFGNRTRVTYCLWTGEERRVQSIWVIIILTNRTAVRTPRTLPSRRHCQSSKFLEKNTEDHVHNLDTLDPIYLGVSDVDTPSFVVKGFT